MKKALVVCCHNHLDMTKKFLDSAISELDNTYDLYVLDNGSCDGTDVYLEKFCKENNTKDSTPFIYFTKTDINHGFAGGNNILIRQLLKNNTELAKLHHDSEDFYSHVIFINNDTIVQKNAMNLLTDICNPKDLIGATGPISNYVAGLQYADVKGLSDDNYRDYAKQLASAQDIHITEVNRLIGFCLCVHINILKEIGEFDEHFGFGMFEDDDYCLRIRNAGYKLIMVKNSIIYHYGSSTIKDFNVNELYKINECRFKEKHKSKINKINIINGYDTELLQQSYDSGYSWVLLLNTGESISTEIFKNNCKFLENVNPNIDLIKLKIVDVKDNKPIPSADWQGRLLRLRKRKNGTFLTFKDIPQDGQTYGYGTIYKTASATDLISQEKISVAMIVKNEGKYLRNCLESIKDFVDEIIIVDTGSTDSTKAIAQQYTNKVYDFKWTNSFADARNFSLSKCTCPWILRIDGDEEVPLDAKVNIYNALINQEADMFMLPIKNFQPDGSAPMSMTLRVFRNNPELRYEGRVHEEISISAKKLGMTMRKINNYLLHYGYLKGMHEQKTDFYFNLLMLDYQDNPKNSATCMNIANHYVHTGKFDTALNFYKECIECLDGEVDPIIFHDFAICKYKLFLSKHQQEIKEILGIFDKANNKADACYPEQQEKFKKNYNIIKGMLLA